MTIPVPDIFTDTMFDRKFEGSVTNALPLNTTNIMDIVGLLIQTIGGLLEDRVVTATSVPCHLSVFLVSDR